MASDDSSVLDELVSTFRPSLNPEPVAIIDAEQSLDLGSFSETVANSCASLITAIKATPPTPSDLLHQNLSICQQRFRDKRRQGFLVINKVDLVLEMQTAIEIEGPFREIMQFQDNVAIAWMGSREWIIRIQQYDRPFYLSHRTFWL